MGMITKKAGDGPKGAFGGGPPSRSEYTPRTTPRQTSTTPQKTPSARAFEEGLKKNPAAAEQFRTLLRNKSLVSGDPTRYNGLDTTRKDPGGQYVYRDSTLGDIPVSSPPPITKEELLKLEARDPAAARVKTRELMQWRRDNGIVSSGMGSVEADALKMGGYDLPAIEEAMRTGRLTPQEVRRMANLGSSEFGTPDDPTPAWVTDRRAHGLDPLTELPKSQPIRQFNTLEEADAYHRDHYFDAFPGLVNRDQNGGLNYAGQNIKDPLAKPPPPTQEELAPSFEAGVNSTPENKTRFANAYLEWANKQTPTPEIIEGRRKALSWLAQGNQGGTPKPQPPPASPPPPSPPARNPWAGMTPEQFKEAVSQDPDIHNRWNDLAKGAYPDLVRRYQPGLFQDPPYEIRYPGPDGGGGKPQPIVPFRVPRPRGASRAMSMPNRPDVDPTAMVESLDDMPEPVVPPVAAPKTVSPGGNQAATTTGVSSTYAPPAAPAAAPQGGDAASQMAQAWAPPADAAQAPVSTKGSPAANQAFDYDTMINKLDGIQQAIQKTGTIGAPRTQQKGIGQTTPKTAGADSYSSYGDNLPTLRQFIRGQ